MLARPSKPRFSGGFKTFSVRTISNHEKGFQCRLVVYSDGSRPKVFEYLWLKLLWDSLSKEEMELIYYSNELNNPLKFSILKSINLKGKRFVRERLQILFPGGEYSRIRYQGFKRLNVEIHREQRSLPKPKKFSGWIRSSSRKGSKRPSGATSFLEALTNIDTYVVKKEIDWEYLLTVDDIKDLPQWEGNKSS